MLYEVITDGQNQAGNSPLQQQAFIVIFQSHTPAGRLFDLLLILAILISVGAVILESVAAIRVDHARNNFV